MGGGKGEKRKQCSIIEEGGKTCWRLFIQGELFFAFTNEFVFQIVFNYSLRN